MKFILIIVIAEYASLGMANSWRQPSVTMQEFADQPSCLAAAATVAKLAREARLDRESVKAACVPAAEEKKQ